MVILFIDLGSDQKKQWTAVFFRTCPNQESGASIPSQKSQHRDLFMFGCQFGVTENILLEGKVRGREMGEKLHQEGKRGVEKENRGVEERDKGSGRRGEWEWKRGGEKGSDLLFWNRKISLLEPEKIYVESGKGEQM
jgi:hypothetical protein